MAKLRADIISSAAQEQHGKVARRKTTKIPKLLPKGVVVVLESIGSTSVLWALEFLYLPNKNRVLMRTR